MSDKVARALGAAASTEPLTCNGKPYEVRPVSIKYLTEIERECLRQYRRSYLENFKESMDLTGATHQDLMTEVEKAGRWDAHDLPMKVGFVADSLVITERLRAWLHEQVLDEEVTNEKRLKLITAAALDAGMLKESEYIEMAGKPPRKGRQNYISWWVTGAHAGMIEMIYAALRDQGITKEDIYIELGSNFARLAELSREAEMVTRPAVDVPEGNGKAGTATAKNA